MISLRCYDPGSGGGGIHNWYDQQISEAAQGAVDAALEMLIQENNLDDLRHYKPLRGACDGLDEIIVDLPKGPKYRILCFRGPAQREVTLLFGFEKTSRGSADYASPCWAANRRKEGVVRDGRKAPPCRFP
jgi:hypothetical protein